MNKRKRYSDEFRASAILMLEAAGYPDRKGALAAVSRQTGAPPPTLHRWARSKQNPPPSDMVIEKRFDLRKAIREELEAIFHEAKDARQDATYHDLMWAAGVLTDKELLLAGKPTGIIKVVQLIQEGKVNPKTVMERWPNLASELFAQAGIDVDTSHR